MDLCRYEREREAIAAAVARRVARKTRRDPARVQAHLRDIAGGFDRRVYLAITSLIRPVANRVELAGPLERVRVASREGTVVFAPTHASNLDSLLLGTCLIRAGLPACVYATGKHMYRSRPIAAALGKLGAYRVDRAETSRLYLLVLAEYAAELIERGFHSIVFPGATRCRTGAVERELKLGLLGAALRAGAPVRIVPVTINYATVLEARTLIQYHLEGRGHERIVGEESFGWGRVPTLLRRVWRLSGSVVVKFGEPLSSGIGKHDLGGALADAFERNTVWFATHVVARALFDALAGRSGTDDASRLSGLPRGERSIPAEAAAAAVARAGQMLRSAASPGGVHPSAEGVAPEALVSRAQSAWRACHGSPPLVREADRVVIEDVPLLSYYRNRTAHVAATPSPWS